MLLQKRGAVSIENDVEASFVKDDGAILSLAAAKQKEWRAEGRLNCPPE